VRDRLDEYFNTDCFTGPPVISSDGGTGFGNTTPGLLRGPAQHNVDLALRKTTAITERTSLEFRAEFFNAFNSTQFANPNTTFSDGTPAFRRITGTSLAPRIGQLALKLYFLTDGAATREDDEPKNRKPGHDCRGAMDLVCRNGSGCGWPEALAPARFPSAGHYPSRWDLQRKAAAIHCHSRRTRSFRCKREARGEGRDLWLHCSYDKAKRPVMFVFKGGPITAWGRRST